MAGPRPGATARPRAPCRRSAPRSLPAEWRPGLAGSSASGPEIPHLHTRGYTNGYRLRTGGNRGNVNSVQPVEALQRLRRQLTRAEFEKKYPHPWLLRELEDAEQSAMFRTMVSVKRAPTAPRKPTAGAPFLTSLAADPSRFGLYAVSKSGSNPWADRVLVGRASNNDIVL